MEQELVIKIPEGKKAIQQTDENGNIVVSFVDVKPIRSKSWKEFCNNHPNYANEWYVTSYGNISFVSPDEYTATRTPAYLATKEDAEGILAFIQLIRLRDEWIGDWEPDWAGKSSKFCIAYQSDMPAVIEWTTFQHALSFPKQDLAIEFLNCFRDLIRKAKRFI